ncbi:cation:proton antiporter [Aliagarivorans taiwanensis]|uniref:cation:proton antiporter domain-containing protein n=1 Tax=Aliagarivorans taiwanensis TaxID=561966 RepID=UPI000402E1DB|nr:cation:proton antiporter [Aliagarivorans taiwanensis]
MSLGIVFFCVLFFGLYASKLVNLLRLPGVLGMVFVGIALGYYVGDALPPSLEEGAGFLKTLALIIILLKAGLGISRATLSRAGLPALLMTFIPCLFEGIALSFVLQALFDFDVVVAGLTGFMLAAVSPAVVVPSMLELKAEGYGSEREVPTIVLAGASVDDVIAITLFSLCLGMATTGDVAWHAVAWQIPVSIITGLLPGLALGLLLAWVFKRYNLPLVEKILLMLTLAVLLVEFGHWINAAALLGVMAMGFILLEKAEQQATELSSLFGHIWYFAQIALFVLIGLSVDVGVAIGAGATGLLAIMLGLVARSIGVLLATQFSSLTFKERLFCVIAYSPKATVQAALGGVALAAGVPEGEIILALAVMAIIFTAPMGLIGLNLFARKLLTTARPATQASQGSEKRAP